MSRTHASATIASMGPYGYRLAMADRAFAFDGAYRAPTSLSVADRAAYGLRSSAACDRSAGFTEALHAATGGKLQSVADFHNVPAGHIKCGADLYSPAWHIKCGADLYGRPADHKGPPYIIERRPCITRLPKQRAMVQAGTSPSITIVRAAIGDISLRIVALRGRVFVGVKNTCSIHK
jgi:hypothetical protein